VVDLGVRVVQAGVVGPQLQVLVDLLLGLGVPRALVVEVDEGAGLVEALVEAVGSRGSSDSSALSLASAFCSASSSGKTSGGTGGAAVREPGLMYSSLACFFSSAIGFSLVRGPGPLSA
jgi:hypothetical protein